MCIYIYIRSFKKKKRHINCCGGAPTCKNPTHEIWSLQIERSKNGGSNKKLPGPSIFFGKGAFGMVITGHYNQHNPLRPLKCSPQKSSRKNTWKNDAWRVHHPFLDFSVTFSEANVRFFLLGGITHGIHQNNQQHLHQVLSPQKWDPCNDEVFHHGFSHVFFQTWPVLPYGPPSFHHPPHPSWCRQ